MTLIKIFFALFLLLITSSCSIATRNRSNMSSEEIRQEELNRRTDSVGRIR